MLIKDELLLPFNIKTKSGFYFTKKSYDWLFLDEIYYGETVPLFNHSLNLNQISHRISNIKIYDYGVFGDIEILNTQFGELLSRTISVGIKQYVIRPRTIHEFTNNVIKISNIIAFDILDSSDDWFDINDINKIIDKHILKLRLYKINKIRNIQTIS